MKAILFLCFLACISCTNIIDVALCLIKTPKFKEEALNIYEAVKTKDFVNILKTATTAFVSLKEVALNECVDDDVNLKLLNCEHLFNHLSCLKKNCGLPDSSPRYNTCLHECYKIHCV